jgi:gamma-glutamyl-gamma-aminobutyrate hydrolase PuuD
MHLIGIVGRCYYNKDDQKMVQTHEPVRRLLANRDYCVSITLLPPDDVDYLEINQGEDKVSKKVDYILDKCDAFIVPGGTYYYSFDEYVMKYAIEHDKPLLCICLGFQALCTMFAKNREQFIMHKRVNLENHYGDSKEYKHDVLLNENTYLKKIIGKDRISVNSVHHDIIDFEMNDLVINAKSDDGILEGVELPNKKFVLGLQWHPECLMDENTEKIINEFIKNMKE